MSQKLWVLISNLLLLGFQLSTASLGSRSILRTIDHEHGEPHDYAVDLNATVFDSSLRETPATFAIVEFYAHWWVFPIYLSFTDKSRVFFLFKLCGFSVLFIWLVFTMYKSWRHYFPFDLSKEITSKWVGTHRSSLGVCFDGLRKTCITSYFLCPEFWQLENKGRANLSAPEAEHWLKDSPFLKFLSILASVH